MIDKVYLVTPRGFCAGVEMAIKALSWMLKIYDETIYCYHEIVHNKWIVEKFQNNNVVFVEDPSDIPNGAVVMLSAHGTSPTIESVFNEKSSLTINSVCPLVTKVHHEAKRYTDKSTQVIYVGHKGHDEAIGALGVSPKNMHLVENIDDVEKLNIDGDAALLAQTTLAISEWEPIMMSSKNKFENLYMPRKSDLCYATTNRQSAILDVLPNVDSVLVVGSENSSNTNALVKMVESKDVKAYRIEDTEDLKKIKIDGNVALTAGASAPDYLVFNIINELKPFQIVDFEHKNEDEYFPLPKELRNNVKLIASFLEVFNQSENFPEKNNGISNDKNWSATEALSSL